MAATTHRGITYTPSLVNDAASSAAITVNLDLQLQGGVDQDDGTWISAYPGALTDFAARQSDGTNRANPRLIFLTMTAGDFTEGSYLTLSSATYNSTTGEKGASISKVLSVMAQRADATANISIVKTSDLVLTFGLKATGNGTSDDSTAMELMLLVV